MIQQFFAPQKPLLLNQSMAATFSSAGVRVPQRQVCFQVVTVNSDAAGTWRMQGTNVTDGKPQLGASTTDADWVTFTQGMTNPSDSASANESFLFFYDTVPTTFVRLLWTRTSGTSASKATVYVDAKGV